MIKTFKQRNAARKSRKCRLSISITEKSGRKVLIAETVDDDFLPYLAVDQYVLSDKALMKKRKQICHELDNATAIVLKELNGI